MKFAFKMRLSLLFLGLFSVCHAHTPSQYRYTSEADIESQSCGDYLSKLATFCDDPQMEDCYCVNNNSMASYMGCLSVEGKLKPTILESIVQSCAQYNVTVEQLEDAYEYYQTSAVSADDIPDFNVSVPVDVPILVDEEIVMQYKLSYVYVYGTYNNSLYYGFGPLGYWVLALLIASIAHWTKFLAPGFVKKRYGRYTNWFRKNFTMSAVCKNRTEPMKIRGIPIALIPTRVETAVSVGYLVVVIVCSGSQIKYYADDKYYSDGTKSLAKYVAVRTGILASYSSPLLILFAGRNNFLQWATGWNFATFMGYHRWVGRVVFILVLVHTVGYTISFADQYAEYMADNYMIWGTIATIASGLILGQGLLVLRRMSYEIFLFWHIVLAVLFVAGSWLHVDTLGYVNWYYATTAIWCIDRVVRVIRGWGYSQASQPGQTVKMRVGIEGPYGESTPARYCDTAVFVAGGNGIPGIYSEAYDLARRDSKQKVKLVWIVRDYKSLDWFYEELQFLKGKNIETIVYLTRPTNQTAESDKEKKKTDDSDGSSFKVAEDLCHVEFRHGRPDVEDFVKHEIEESNGSIAFVTCGHPEMVDHLRYVVSHNLSEEKRIEFYEQLQVWS
ncbi:hypothetical protein CANTEDRAFT_133661 [Yamadazyma tenuis ATCC 10573]|uniref:FAD-binding FR-type domain-containing protein n=1 Tax=Candida tenuis (strain ATCC 10573 / BCRC 21748 / CBS 615 / JCM 9827 / NBRC 10315 / NRRL Y-1498 / VKM Y-70) TaxID=590646 RepID=G3B0B3_CANTC|nr:uncharacterized protein CANTEDRAFT_133661 [Yamadazyma tenuis ATCC 10573]EGV65359.1 hypothetical protein CANTEDRAFT_133661 [Yamadazyma tenuis ATCC 10573]